MEYLDKTGLTHLWSKLKEKLNNKADHDQYKIINISTKKVKYPTITESSKFESMLRLMITSGNNFEEQFPEGYFISCILAVKYCYFLDETHYNNNDEQPVSVGYSILPPETYSGSYVQRWTVSPGYNISAYGEKIYYTLLLEKYAKA